MRVSKRAKRAGIYWRREDRKGAVRLDMMENLFGPPPSIFRIFQAIDSETISTYPEYGEVVEVVAGRFGVPKGNIIVGNGSDELIQNTFDAFCDEGDPVLIPQPTFAVIKMAAERVGARIISVDYNDDLSFPKKEFLKKLENGPRVAVIVTPNNPTGTYVERRFILEAASRFPETLFLIDEAYGEFGGESVIKDAADSDNLLVLRTLSKAYGLAGLRFGYGVGSDRIIKVLESVRMPYSVNAVAAYVASLVLLEREWLDKTVKKIISERKRLKGSLLMRGIQVIETDANFVLAHFGDMAEEITSLLKSQGVLVKDLSGTHHLMKGFVRISVGTPDANGKLLQALDRLLPTPAVVFDVDGTIIDVGESYHRTIIECVRQLVGETITFSEIYDLKNSSGYNDDIEIVSELCGRRGKTVSYNEIEPLFNRIYEGEPFGAGTVRNERLLIDEGLLKRLASSFKLALFTGRSERHLRLALKRFGIERYFEVVFTVDETPKNMRKPHPYGLLKVVEMLGCKRGCYIGDIPDDVRAAKAAGLTAISVLPPVKDRESYRKALMEAGSDFILEEINQLWGLLYG